jgi:hypothetical protein
MVGPGAVLVSAAGDLTVNDELVTRRLDDADEEVFIAVDDDEDGSRFSPAAATRTNNRDGDRTRGNDGTGSGDGGTRTSNRDGDRTRGNDGTKDGDNTTGQDGTGGGNNTNTGQTQTRTGGDI